MASFDTLNVLWIFPYQFTVLCFKLVSTTCIKTLG